VGTSWAQGPRHHLKPSRRYSRRAIKTLDPQSLTQHVDRMYRAAWALCGRREDAEDLVQETFARVLARPRVVRGEDEAYYLMRALRNTFYTSRRTASRRPLTGAELDDIVVADPRPTSRPERAIEVQELYAQIAQLPEDFRLALVAVDVLGLSYREAARALKAREATITTRLFRARRLIARALDPKPAPRTEPEPEPARESAAPQQVRAGQAPREESASREESRASGVLPSGGTS
jgi:RNA polymerase sigma-70 factor (ECF subfamily)